MRKNTNVYPATPPPYRIRNAFARTAFDVLIRVRAAQARRARRDVARALFETKSFEVRARRACASEEECTASVTIFGDWRTGSCPRGRFAWETLVGCYDNGIVTTVRDDSVGRRRGLCRARLTRRRCADERRPQFFFQSRLTRVSGRLPKRWPAGVPGKRVFIAWPTGGRTWTTKIELFFFYFFFFIFHSFAVVNNIQRKTKKRTVYRMLYNYVVRIIHCCFVRRFHRYDTRV